MKTQTPASEHLELSRATVSLRSRYKVRETRPLPDNNSGPTKRENHCSYTNVANWLLILHLCGSGWSSNKEIPKSFLRACAASPTLRPRKPARVPPAIADVVMGSSVCPFSRLGHGSSFSFMDVFELCRNTQDWCVCR